MKILRWISVLPGAILAALIANFLVYYLFQSSFELVGGSKIYREFVSSLFSYLAFSLAYISAGAFIAPSYKSKVAMGLMILFVPVAIGLIILQIINSEFFSIPTFSFIVALGGTVLGYLMVLDSGSR